MPELEVQDWEVDQEGDEGRSEELNGNRHLTKGSEGSKLWLELKECGKHELERGGRWLGRLGSDRQMSPARWTKLWGAGVGSDIGKSSCA